MTWRLVKLSATSIVDARKVDVIQGRVRRQRPIVQVPTPALEKWLHQQLIRTSGDMRISAVICINHILNIIDP